MLSGEDAEDSKFNEADTIAKLINPALYEKGWTENFIKREVTAGVIEIVNGVPRQRKRGRADIVLRLQPLPQKQPVSVSVIEAKAEKFPPTLGLEQAKKYAQRLHVPVVFSTNGHRFVEFDRMSGITSNPKSISEFPNQETLRSRYEKWVGFKLDSPAAQPLLTPYVTGDSTVRYYQDAAIRAVLEKIARCEVEGTAKRALLSLATGAGKTRIAVHLLKRIADTGQRVKALFVCDRIELREQASRAFKNVFGANAAVVDSNNHQRNAQVLIATYHALGVADDDDASFLIENYPENYFSHIIIDECHRSAWGKWSIILKRNSAAVQIGLTATPRVIEVTQTTAEVIADEQITANNIQYFGEPVYEYDMLQGVEDGYLAACEIREGRIKLDLAQLTIEDILASNPVDFETGLAVEEKVIRRLMKKGNLKTRLMLPNFEKRRCEDLFHYLLETGGAEQKTIIFCNSDRHADLVSANMENLYAEWCEQNQHRRCDSYAFKCTDKGGGQERLPDFRGSSRSYFIATTVDLLTTGVDVPVVRNIVFFNQINSPITFYQMVGRGTRLAEGKLMFRVYDYTDATRLFGESFLTKLRTPNNNSRNRSSEASGLAIEIADGDEWIEESTGNRFMRAKIDGDDWRISVEEYKERIAAKLVEIVPTIEDFRACWINPKTRKELSAELVSAGISPKEYATVAELAAYDLYDILADIAYGLIPKTKSDRAQAFNYKHADWLNSMPEATAKAVMHFCSNLSMVE
ncbi:DEAD/DEAH box helicase family protein [Nostoc sp. 2RC]|uniref:DEAD/DEAH box helicase family protein n=1 Tax=Nostoc sp. 2RC TaxID=2485484 RepID=UPI001624F836|nr:DEAD/DEAH box helicase family protein [Nostoc sp. 2RC]MBC1240001.1 DEAD/DEAH box helicase family protein [Nostoc sp. 2RC]